MASDTTTNQATPASADDNNPTNWQAYDIAGLYDSIGPKYEAAYRDIPAQQRSLSWLLSQLPAARPDGGGGRILDIGCGTGRPVASTLAAAGHRVHGIDISPTMLAAARAAVPSATFELVDFRLYSGPRAEEGEGTLDAVTCYFALLVAMSQDEIRDTVRKVKGWLRKGGLFVLATIPADVEHRRQDWLGRRGVFSSLSVEQYKRLLEEEDGFEVEFAEVENFMPRAAEAGICGVEQVEEEPQLFVYARKK